MVGTEEGREGGGDRGKEATDHDSKYNQDFHLVLELKQTSIFPVH